MTPDILIFLKHEVVAMRGLFSDSDTFCSFLQTGEKVPWLSSILNFGISMSFRGTIQHDTTELASTVCRRLRYEMDEVMQQQWLVTQF